MTIASVAMDDVEAVKWLRKAAEQGDADTQYNLVLLYINGNGVGRDYVGAYMWLSLSAAQGKAEARGFLDMAEQKMTRDQIVEAQKLASAWKAQGELAHRFRNFRLHRCYQLW